MPSAQELAQSVQNNGSITLATTHASGVVDNANAAQNIADTANGLPAQRSSYIDGSNTGPGGSVALDPNMLQGMLNLANAGFTFTVSEIAGGVHSPNSRHYAGVAFDVNVLNGAAVNASNASVASFKTSGAAQGATEILGPGDPGHDTHVHLGWPRPSAAGV
jgi:hypothetical protein